MSFFNKLKTNIVEEKEKEIEKEVKKESPNEKKGDKKNSKRKDEKEVRDWLKSEGQLAVDVYQTNSEFYIQAPIAGVSPEDLEISVENEMLTIKGERKEPDIGNKEKNYFYQECYWGPFSRQIILPEDADTDRIKASLEKVILIIKVPKVTKIKKKKINISVSA